jgi:hydrogenase/urease accessory protein HupE
VVSFAFIRVAVHLPRDDLLIELTVMLDGIVVAIRQDSRSELLFAVIAVKSNDGSLEFGAGR